LRLLVPLLLLAASACGPRQVEVRTAADLPPEAAIVVENSLPLAVNVYVIDSGTELFLRQVPARGSVRLPVRGVPTGRRVTLRATTRDGSRTFTRENVVLDGTYRWTLP
jgi:hypothetical protein